MGNDHSRGNTPDEELRAKLLQRKWLLMQRNRLGYGLSLGAVLLFFGIGGGKPGLLLAGALAVAVGLYFFIRFEKERREIEEELHRVFPNGIPDKLPKAKK